MTRLRRFAAARCLVTAARLAQLAGGLVHLAARIHGTPLRLPPSPPIRRPLTPPAGGADLIVPVLHTIPGLIVPATWPQGRH